GHPVAVEQRAIEPAALQKGAEGTDRVRDIARNTQVRLLTLEELTQRVRVLYRVFANVGCEQAPGEAFGLRAEKVDVTGVTQFGVDAFEYLAGGIDEDAVDAQDLLRCRIANYVGAVGLV